MTTEAPAFPIPTDFDGRFLQWDKMHCPRPQTPLTEEVFLKLLGDGFSDAMDEFSCPVGLRYHVLNRYAFAEVSPFDMPETPEFAARLERYQATMHDVLPKIGDLWANEWLPSIMPGIERAKSADYSSLSDEEYLAEYDRLLRDFYERYVVHGKINFVTISASMFADFYNAEFSPDDPTEAYQLLGGYPTRSVDAARGLWALGRTIHNSEALHEIFANNEPADIPDRLGESEEGQAFQRALTDYLDEFGWRSDVFELADPTWRETPTIPLNTLQGYMDLDESHNPEARYQEAIALRERLMAQAQERLADQPEKLGEFNGLHDMARHYLTLTEDHNFWIDQVGNAVVRKAAMEFGRRLAGANAIADQSDVFWLYRDDIARGLGGEDLRATVEERRTENERWAPIVPPPIIGEPPPPSGDPLEAALGKMFGEPAEPSGDPNVLNGIGASAGTVQGTARVVKDLSEASKVREGDILVCEMTMPPWTPLFAIASAVVADTGGVLSHCAIVSREYGMPCVVGTAVGTAVLKDGMQLTVDGSRGVVRIDSR
jgi:phosphohistidine swiveling domain-containing protein